MRRPAGRRARPKARRHRRPSSHTHSHSPARSRCIPADLYRQGRLCPQSRRPLRAGWPLARHRYGRFRDRGNPVAEQANRCLRRARWVSRATHVPSLFLDPHAQRKSQWEVKDVDVLRAVKSHVRDRTGGRGPRHRPRKSLPPGPRRHRWPLSRSVCSATVFVHRPRTPRATAPTRR